MNEESTIEKADQYIKWVQSGQKTDITEKTQELGRRWVKAYNLLLKWPTESEALRMHMNTENLSDDVARRDLYIAQYVFGKIRMPNRNFLLQKQLADANKFLEVVLSDEPIDKAMYLKALELRNKIISMLPEEVEPPSMDVFNQRIYYTMDPAVLGKTKKDFDAMRNLYESIKRKTAPQLNLDAHAEDATVVRS